MEEGINILKIDRNERDYLVLKGVKFGENGISKNHIKKSGRQKYYLCPSAKNIKLHNDYQNRVL